jgi:Ca-activated chloride channel family protein
MKSPLLVVLLLFPLLAGFDLLQSPNRAVEEGNARLKAGKADDALGQYDKAVKSLPVEPGVHFDRGAALFALSRFDEAVQEFLRATEARTPALKAAAFYNLGNGLFKLEKYPDAIAAYRRCLAIDPTDVRAKWNLELALKKKKDKDEKDKQDQQQQSKKQDQDKNKQDQQGKQDQKKDPENQKDKPDQQAKQDQPKPQPDEDKQKEQEKQQKEQAQQDKDKDKDKDKEKDKKDPGEAAGAPPPSDKAPDMREIEAVLDSLERSPKDLEKERAQARAVRRAPPRKNW